MRRIYFVVFDIKFKDGSGGCGSAVVKLSKGKLPNGAAMEEARELLRAGSQAFDNSGMVLTDYRRLWFYRWAKGGTV